MKVTDKERVRHSPNYKRGVFQNLSPTPLMAKDASYPKVIWEAINRPTDTKPPLALPTRRSDISRGSVKPVITWFGHSSYLIQVNNINILVDPVFSGHASPLSWMVKAFPGTDIYSAADFPDIDILIITHNHYDHLDRHTIQQLRPKIRSVYTALGAGNDIRYVDPAIITELDWWESTQIAEDILLTALPARHFSGRGIQRNATLWASFALKLFGYNFYIGGDSGYDTHFVEIGEKFGPFDMAMIECGQYNIAWPFIHMMPEQTAQAAIDLKAKVLLPVHWGKFTLANHPWNEPVKRVLKKATELGLKVATPMIGEQVVVNEAYPENNWWDLSL
jgi:L-ascorbate metabolism protein UlaG (beta-lactamase superfamily)